MTRDLHVKSNRIINFREGLKIRKPSQTSSMKLTYRYADASNCLEK